MLEITLKSVRIRQNMTIGELAKLSGVSAAHICYIENGTKNPTVNILWKLAKAMEVRIEELYIYDYFVE